MPKRNGKKKKVAKLVRLGGCQPFAINNGTPNSRWMALLTFRYRQADLPPMVLQLYELRRLFIAAAHLLARYGDKRDKPHVALVFSRMISTSTTRPSKKELDGQPHIVDVATHQRKKIEPSRSSTSPTTPITRSETWMLHRLLTNVRTHSDFLRFIGVVEEPSKTEESAREKTHKALPVILKSMAMKPSPKKRK